MSPEHAKILQFEISLEHLNNYCSPYYIGYYQDLTKSKLLLAKDEYCQICSVIYPEENYDLKNKLPSLFSCSPTPIKTDDFKKLNIDNELIENIQIAKNRLQNF